MVVGGRMQDRGEWKQGFWLGDFCWRFGGSSGGDRKQVDFECRVNEIYCCIVCAG